MAAGRTGWPYEPVAGAPSAFVEAAPVPPAPASPEPEVDDRPPPARAAVVALAVAGVIAVLLAGLAVTDWWVRNAELDTLLGRIERAERAQLLPLQVVVPLVSDCQDTSPCDTAAIRVAAERSLPQLQSTGDAVATTRLTRSHTAVRHLRDRYLDHNLAWQSWMRALADDPGAASQPAPTSIRTTFRQAAESAEAAVPPLPLRGARSRIDRIFASAP